MTSGTDKSLDKFIKDLTSAGIVPDEAILVQPQDDEDSADFAAWEAQLSELLKKADATTGNVAIFEYLLGERVKITCSGEVGEVTGRAEYFSTDEESYYIRYKAADGRATEAWWGGSALEPVND